MLDLDQSEINIDCVDQSEMRNDCVDQSEISNVLWTNQRSVVLTWLTMGDLQNG